MLEDNLFVRDNVTYRNIMRYANVLRTFTQTFAIFTLGVDEHIKRQNVR